MPILDNHKHELFAQALASGSSASAAYSEAGFKPHDSNASRLSRNDKVLSRVAELQSRTAQGLQVTAQWLLERAEEARQGAMNAGQHAAAIAAIKEMGVLSGVRVEKRENGQPGEFDGIGLDELRRTLAERLGVVASRSEQDRAARKQGGLRGQPNRVH